jgi:hypothetical protein
MSGEFAWAEGRVPAAISWRTRELATGANPKTVSERLGHASAAFTTDVYAASVSALEEPSAARVSALLDGARR